MTILLVEDNRFLRLATERALAKAKYRVMSVGDGEAALQAAHADLPELILLDMMLPKMTGPQVLAALKQDSVTSHIPVIVLSGLSQKNEARLMKAGAAAYVEKSEKMWEHNSAGLIQIIENVMAISKQG
jgi:CheY-like chemotaxis protein